MTVAEATNGRLTDPHTQKLPGRRGGLGKTGQGRAQQAEQFLHGATEAVRRQQIEGMLATAAATVPIDVLHL